MLKNQLLIVIAIIAFAVWIALRKSDQKKSDNDENLDNE
jgi:hypothetical protein